MKSIASFCLALAAGLMLPACACMQCSQPAVTGKVGVQVASRDTHRVVPTVPQ